MSSDGRTSKTKPLKPSKKPKKRWGFWRIFGWASAALFMIILIACAYVWQNRYAFLETTFEDIIAEQGLEADISIKNVNKEGARLGAITIAEDGKPVFSAESLSVDYDWREAIKGRMKRIEFTGADLRLTVDKQGKIIDGWLPEPRGDQPLVLPPGGLHLDDSRIEISSPYGPVKASGDLTFLSFEDLKADVTIEPSSFAFGALRASGGGQITANIQPGKNFIKSQLDFTKLSHPLGELGRASVTADVNLDLVDGLSHISGPLEIRFDDLKSKQLSASSGRFDWNGGFAVRPNSAAIREADGSWDISLSGLTYGDAASRQQLARTLTLYDAMSAAPVTTHFAKSLTQSIGALLYEAELTGRGEFLRSGEDVTLALKSPLRIESRQTQAVITPFAPGGQGAGETAPLYAYNRQTEALALNANAKITGARPLNLLGLSVAASSPNGLTLGDISEVSLITELAEEWRASSAEGPVRLAAARADVRFINSGGLREMTARLPFGYDGPLPGGYVRGLLGRGTLRLDMRGGGLKTYFAPADDMPLQAAEFIMPSGWSASGAQFTLPRQDKSAAPLYTRLAGASGEMKTIAENFTGVLREASTGRQLAVKVGRAELSARISPAQQDWEAALSEAEITTDDYIGDNAVFGAPAADVTARLIPDQDVYFTLRADAARAKTDQLSAPAIMIAIKGTPANYHLDFGGESYATAGKIAFAAAELPELPLRGSVDFKDGKFTGESFTVLPKAEDVPIEISFDMQDGRGNAKILIPQLTFAPRKLQPQNLVPSLQGKIADVTGSVAAQIDVSFSPDAPLQSYGRVKIDNLNFGTLPGPFTGVSTEIQLTSVFPLQTSGIQTLTVKKFNPGLPLENGTISYELIPNAINIIDASWPMGGGAISLEPVIWRLNQSKNRVVLTVDDVDLGDLLGGFGGEDLTVTGAVTGELPVVVDGVNVRVEGGVMRVVDGGLIQFSLNPKQAIEATADELNEPNQLSQMALESLRNLRYETLEARMDGALDGPMTVAMSFLGSNPDVLYGAQFKFNTVIKGELFNIARSLKPGSNLSSFKRYIQADRASGSENPAN